MLTQKARVLVAFGVVVALAMHAVTTLLLRAGLDFFANNLIAQSHRKVLILIVLASFGIAVIWGAALLWKDAGITREAIDRVTRLFCPVMVVPVLFGLVRHDFGTEVEEAVILGVTVLALDPLLRASFGAWSEWPRTEPTLAPGLLVRAGRGLRSLVEGFFARPKLVFFTVVALVAGHALYMGTYAVWAHWRFATYGYDLGQYDNIFHSTLAGHPLAAPCFGVGEDWGDLYSHADLAVFYMLPIYLIYPRAETLLVMQAVMLASIAIPLYLIAVNRLPRWIAFIVALAWLLYAPVHGAQLYDVHMQPFGATWVIWALAALDRKRWGLYWLCFTLAILCREDVSIGLFCFGLFLLLTGARPKTGVVTMGIAFSYFLVLRFFVMKSTAFAGMYKDLLAPGEPPDFASVIKTLISNPAFTLKTLVTHEKIRYFFQIFGPMALLPLRRPWLLILAIPAFILTLLTTQYMPTIQISFQYVCNWAAYMFPATVIAIAAYPSESPKKPRYAAALTLLVAAVIGSLQWGAYSFHGSVHGGFGDVPFSRPTEADMKRNVAVEELMKKVPREDKIRLCSSDRVQSHSTFHWNNWSLKDGLYNCDYLIWSNVWGDPGMQRGMQEVATGNYELVEARDGIWLAKKKAPPPPAPQAPAPAP